MLGRALGVAFALAVLGGVRCHAADDGRRPVLEPTAFRIGDQLLQGERGRFAVPENRGRSGSRTIEIAFVRLHHPKGASATAVVYLPGGPGQPVLQALEPFVAAYQAYLRIGGSGDFLLVEQRGVGASEPDLTCPGSLERPLRQPLTKALMARSHVAYVERCKAHFAALGVDIEGYTVDAMAADIEDLRLALGYDRLRLFGESYGALEGLAVIGAYGPAIERAAFSAVLGPDDMFELPSAIEARLQELGRLAASDPALEGRVPDLRRLIDRVLTSLDPPRRVAVRTRDGVVRNVAVGAYDLALATVTLLRHTAFQRQLPALYLAMAGGDFSWLARWSLQVRRGQSLNLMSLRVTCDAGASVARRALIAAEAGASELGEAIDLLGADACAPFAGSIEPRSSPPLVRSDVPLLLVSGGLDPRAPAANAEALLPALANARHVVLPGVAHDFGDARDAQLELVYRFLATGEVRQHRRLPAFTFMPSG